MPKFALRYEHKTVVLPPGEFLIGRAPDADLVVEDRMVSKRHLLLVVTDEHVEAEDCGSRNGSFLNGRRLETREALTVGDLLVVGEQEIRVVSPSTRREKVSTGMSVTRRVRPRREEDGTSEMRQDGERLDDVEAAIKDGDHARAAQSLYVVLRWLRDAAPRREEEDRETLGRLLAAATSYGEATEGWEALAVAIELHGDFLWAPELERFEALKRRPTGMPKPAMRALRKLATALAENRELLASPDQARLEQLTSLVS